MNTKLINHFNEEGNLIVITNYPVKGKGMHSAKLGGVSGFAKNSLIPLSKEYKKQGKAIVVLADILDKPSIYEEEGILVARCWYRGQKNLYMDIAKMIWQFRNIRDVLIEFEFATFGDFAVTSLFPLLVFFLKMRGLKITLVLHQVVNDLWSLLGHLGLQYASFRFRILSQMLPIFYWCLTNMAQTTIVLEEVFRQRLRGIAPAGRIVVIPHGVENLSKLPSKKLSRKKLRIPRNAVVLLSFGFITWYKGTDWLIKTLQNVRSLRGRPLVLLLAGGPSATQRHKPHYQQFYTNLLEDAKASPHITITGFVADEQIPYYFGASDLVVYPYRTVMSSSGPLSMAFAHQKPLLLSPAMRAYLKSSDIKSAITSSKINESLLILPDTLPKVVPHIEKVLMRKNTKKLTRFVEAVAKERYFQKLAHQYFSLLHTEVVKPYPNLKLTPTPGL